jgi:hypothetical protein
MSLPDFKFNPHSRWDAPILSQGLTGQRGEHDAAEK